MIRSLAVRIKCKLRSSCKMKHFQLPQMPINLKLSFIALSSTAWLKRSFRGEKAETMRLRVHHSRIVPTRYIQTCRTKGSLSLELHRKGVEGKDRPKLATKRTKGHWAQAWNNSPKIWQPPKWWSSTTDRRLNQSESTPATAHILSSILLLGWQLSRQEPPHNTSKCSMKTFWAIWL